MKSKRKKKKLFVAKSIAADFTGMMRSAIYGSNCTRRKMLARKEDYLEYIKTRKEPMIYQGLPWFFCQVYNYRFNRNRRYDGIRHKTAASCDTAFAKMFAPRKSFRIDLVFGHLGIVNINRRGVGG